MLGLFDSLFVFVSTIIAIIILGVAASFSPVLYVAQAATSAKKDKTIYQAVALMAGVVFALLLLTLLFQLINIDTLLRFIDTTIRAVLISIFFNVLFGVLFIALGIWYLRNNTATERRQRAPHIRKGAHISAMLSLGFGRTIFSLSGLTATYIAGNTIAAVSHFWTEQIIYTAAFLGAAIAPFFAIWVLTEKGLPALPAIYKRALDYSKTIDYRATLGYGSVAFGGLIVIVNVIVGVL